MEYRRKIKLNKKGKGIKKLPFPFLFIKLNNIIIHINI